MSRDLPNMTATQVLNARHPTPPGEGLLVAMIEREYAAFQLYRQRCEQERRRD